MQLIYIAGPYSHPNERIVEMRMRVVAEVQASYAQRGIHTVSPMEKHHILQYRELPGDWEFWGGLSKTLLRRCDQLLLIKMPGWEYSTGVREELEIADMLGIPVTHIDEQHYRNVIMNDPLTPWPHLS